VLEPGELAVDSALLTGDERALLATRDFDAVRRAQWIRGRAGLRRLAPELGSVLVHDDGAPRPLGAAWAVSLSHAGDHVAVAVLPKSRPEARLAVDLVAHDEAPRLARILSRLKIKLFGGAISETRVWAGLECALKLRRRPIDDLLAVQLEIEVMPGRALVRGLGAPAQVAFMDRSRHLVGLACEP